MARARRAQPRPWRYVLPIVIIAAVLATVIVLWRSDPGVPLTGSGVSGSGPTPAGATGSPTAGTTGATAEPSASTAPSAGPSGSPSASRSPGGTSAGASRALAACRDHVRAGDDLLAAARTGIGHWRGHVQAETDARAGRISEAQKQARFVATRDQGPGDQRAYASARTAYRRTDGSCRRHSGADDATAKALASCDRRNRSQQPVLAAAGRAMADWRRHLADMARSQSRYVPHAKQIWEDTYRKAPRNLDAYAAAVRDYHPPRC